MLPSTTVIYRYEWKHEPEPTPDLVSYPATIPFKGQTFKGGPKFGKLGIWLLSFALGGLLGPVFTRAHLEARYLSLKSQNDTINEQKLALRKLPPAVPLIFKPLTLPDGTTIEPVNRDYSLIIPKIGLNTPVVGSVDPKDTQGYTDMLKKGVAHANTSVKPGENGSTYLFSHSTNFEWFVKDLNAVFYLLKNLDTGDSIVVYYQGRQYNYKIADKKVVKSNDTTYLYPLLGKQQLILQTCWPPGSTAERLLIFADLVEGQVKQI